MTGFDFPGIKVETKALLDFSTGTVDDFAPHLTTLTHELGKLGMKVGLSGLPSGATLGTWNASMLTATGAFLNDVSYGLQAVSTGAASAAAIYQSSDSDSASQMRAVDAAFTPTAGDTTLGRQRAQAERDARRRGAQTEHDILDEATRTSIAGSSTPTPPTAPPANMCVAANPYTAAGAQDLVRAHQGDDQHDAQNGGHSEYDEYQAPIGTPVGASVPGAPQAPSPRPAPSPTPAPVGTMAPGYPASASSPSPTAGPAPAPSPAMTATSSYPAASPSTSRDSAPTTAATPSPEPSPGG
ncbi:hypothetical protein [Cumulibacter manganitolerans]|uniref:hypothetical protein n=1 Tax=Cumulibacter manganitolerans TaxID=1884992 RepID=UPI0012969F4A|nr:hypothetical protein [Cumulibacter manganitolerans]